MQIVYALETPPQSSTHASIFLAGPSPRKSSDPNWREEALQLLDEMGFSGTVFVPLPRNGDWTKDYDHQVEWELKYLNAADCIVFWVPRDMEHSPALTTNVEWGMWYDSGKAVLGYPYDAPHMKYLKHLAGKESVPVSHTLRETLVSAFRQIGSSLLDRSNFKEGEFLKKEYRVGGELAIPLHIWETPSFMAWRNTQVGAGNRIDDAKVVWTFRVGPNKSKVFFWALHVDVWIAAENRHKTNEIVLARPDISAIVGYCRPENKPLPSMKSRSYLLNTRVVIVREFRSPAVTTDCFIRELPGGSSWNGDESPVQVASHEFEEETGVTIPADRFRYLDSRQLIGTLSSHQAHVFAVELSPGEMEALAANRDPHGVEEDTERTYVEVYTVSELLNSVEVDWSNMGMLLSVLLRED